MANIMTNLMGIIIATHSRWYVNAYTLHLAAPDNSKVFL